MRRDGDLNPPKKRFGGVYNPKGNALYGKMVGELERYKNKRHCWGPLKKTYKEHSL